MTPLTPRQAQILKLVASGLGDKLIAVGFGIQESTVRNTLDSAS